MARNMLSCGRSLGMLLVLSTLMVLGAPGGADPAQGAASGGAGTKKRGRPAKGEQAQAAAGAGPRGEGGAPAAAEQEEATEMEEEDTQADTDGGGGLQVREIGTKKGKVDKSKPVILKGMPKHYQDNEENSPWCMMLLIENSYLLAKELKSMKTPYVPCRFRSELSSWYAYIKTEEVYDLMATKVEELSKKEGLRFEDHRDPFDHRISYSTMFQRYRNKEGVEYYVVSMENFYLRQFSEDHGGKFNPNCESYDGVNIKSLPDALQIAVDCGYKVVGNFNFDKKYPTPFKSQVPPRGDE